MAKNISIIGLGLIGGSLAKSIKDFDSSIIISGFDKSDVLSQAKKNNAIDKELKKAEDAVQSDIIFLALPTEKSLQIFEKLAPVLKKDSLITDVCGVKSVFENKWKIFRSEGHYVGGHPMTGKEKGGFENSDPLLFENSVYILSENKLETENYKLLLKLLEGIGARVKFLNPKLHDEIVAKVSHVPQILSTLLVNLASTENKDVNYLDFAAGGFRDMTRIASSDFSLWESVIKNNKEAVVKSIFQLLNDLTDTNRLLLKDDYKSIGKTFENARKKRDEIPKNTKGFINPLFDVFIYVKDEPGVLSKVTTILFKNSINIKDIELLKIREGTGGTFRLSFESKQDADKAKKLVEGIGFKVK